MPTNGTIYLLGDGDREGIYKIGVTRGDVEKRIRKLQTGNSGEIYIVDKYDSAYPFFVEASLHRKYMTKNVMNEWYELSEDEVRQFAESCRQIEELAESLKDNPFFKYDKLK
jgi:hypothetical protein